MDENIKKLVRDLADALATEEATVSLRTPSGELTIENTNGRYTVLLKKGRAKEKLSFKDTWEKAEELLDELL